MKSCDCGTHWLPWLSNAFLLSRNKHQGLSRVPLSRKTPSPYWNYIDYVRKGDAARFSEPKCLCHNDGDWSFTLFLQLQLCQVCKDYNYFLRKRLWLWGSLEMLVCVLCCVPHHCQKSSFDEAQWQCRDDQLTMDPPRAASVGLYLAENARLGAIRNCPVIRPHCNCSVILSRSKLPDKPICF